MCETTFVRIIEGLEGSFVLIYVHLAVLRVEIGNALGRPRTFMEHWNYFLSGLDISITPNFS